MQGGKSDMKSKPLTTWPQKALDLQKVNGLCQNASIRKKSIWFCIYAEQIYIKYISRHTLTYWS